MLMCKTLNVGNPNLGWTPLKIQKREMKFEFIQAGFKLTLKIKLHAILLCVCIQIESFMKPNSVIFVRRQIELGGLHQLR